jgi:uncharacterized protein YjiS (DUF1127 family)
MEMIMSTLAAYAAGSALPLLRAAAPITSRLKQWWSAYFDWRAQQAVIACLSSMSDRDLKDIGLTRGEIPFAVKRGWPSPRR